MEGRAVTLELLGTNEQEVAYLAGLFDGEGSVSVNMYSQKPNYAGSLKVGISMTTPEPLRLCQRIFGGKVRLEKYRNHWKPCSRWRLHGDRAETFLRAVEPYLIVKKDKAALALSFRALGRGYSAKKRELAELISPHRNTNHDVNPDGLNAHST